MSALEKIWAGSVSKPFAKYCWLVLAYTVFVIVWGAYVRATGSGAGCGSHWPTCQGEVLHRPERIETLIELSHRLTSAALGLLSVVQVIWAFRVAPRGHAVRKAAVAGLVFIIIEGGLGAGLVLFELVADNPSSARAAVVGAHLVNTMLLTACLVLTAWYASGGTPIRLRQHRQMRWILGYALVAMLILSAFGAITALGDTLFPIGSLQEGLAQDFDPSSHFAVRMRIWHPVLAVLTSAYILALIYNLEELRSTPVKRLFSYTTAIAIVLQVALGALNVVLLAPVWMQMVHLTLSNVLWISLLLLTAVNLADAVPAAVGETAKLIYSANGQTSHAAEPQLRMKGLKDS